MKAINSEQFRAWVCEEVQDIQAQIADEGESDFLKAWRDTFENVWNKISEFEFDAPDTVSETVTRSVPRGRKPKQAAKVLRYLDKHPDAIHKSSRELAVICGVGRQTVLRAIKKLSKVA